MSAAVRLDVLAATAEALACVWSGADRVDARALVDALDDRGLQVTRIRGRKPQRVQVWAHVDPDLYNRLSDRAVAERVPLAEVLRRVIAEGAQSEPVDAEEAG